MAWRSAGSLSRSLSRASSLRSTPPMPRLRPPQSASRHHPLRFSSPRNLGELGCTASFLPFTSVARISSHLTVNVRAYTELSHGTFCRTCQDRYYLKGVLDQHNQVQQYMEAVRKS